MQWPYYHSRGLSEVRVVLDRSIFLNTIAKRLNAMILSIIKIISDYRSMR